MTELEKLIEQKRQLELKIKEMMNNSLIHCGVSKFEFNPTDNKYRLAIEAIQTRNKYETKDQVAKRLGKYAHYYCDRETIGTYEAGIWYSLIRTDDKQTAINYIDKIINDFSELKKTIEEGKNNETDL